MIFCIRIYLNWKQTSAEEGTGKFSVPSAKRRCLPLMSKVSTSPMNWRSGSRWARIGAEISKDWRWVNAASTSLVQQKSWRVDVKVVGSGHNLAIVAVEVAVISLNVYRKGGYLSEIFPIKVEYWFWLG